MNNSTNQIEPKTCSFKFLICCFTLSRFLVFLIIGLVANTFSYEVPARHAPMLHSISNLDLPSTIIRLKKILLSADASWYMEIANYGYPIKDYTNTEALHWVFFPLFPILVKCFGLITGSTLIGALFLNILCLFFSLLVIRRYLISEGFSENLIKLVIALICFHPLSYFLSTPHTESVFLLCLSTTLLCLQKRSLPLSSLAFGLCIISRPTGLLIAPGMALLAKKRGVPVLPFSLLSSIPFLCFCTYLWKITGNPLAWLQNQSAWGRKGNFLDLFSFDNFGISNFVAPWSLNIMHILFLALLIVVIAMQFKEKAWGFLLVTIVPVLSALSSGTLLSISRLIMPLVTVPITLVKNLSEDKLLLFVLVYAVLLGVMTLFYALRVSFAMT